MKSPKKFWRSYSKFEVDFLLIDVIAIEVKAKNKISHHDVRGLSALGEEVELKRRIVVSYESVCRRDEQGNKITPVAEFLDQLWAAHYSLTPNHLLHRRPSDLLQCIKGILDPWMESHSV